MKTLLLTLSLIAIPLTTYAQAPIPTCDPTEDPYQCGCPLELQDKVARCEVFDVASIPDFTDPSGDKSDWMSTEWEQSRGKWKVTVDLDAAPTGPYFRPVETTFESVDERHQWLSEFYGVPLDENGAIESYYVVQRGIGMVFDPATNTFEEMVGSVGTSILVNHLGCEPYLNGEANPELNYVNQYYNSDVAILDSDTLVNSITNTCHRLSYLGPNEPGFHSQSTAVSRTSLSGRIEDEDLAATIDAAGGDPRVVSIPEVIDGPNFATPIIDGTALDYCFNENNDPCFLDYLGQYSDQKIRFIFMNDAVIEAEAKLQRWLVTDETNIVDFDIAPTLETYSRKVTGFTLEYSQNPIDPQGNDSTRLTSIDMVKGPLWHPFDLACVEIRLGSTQNQNPILVQTATGQYLKNSNGSYQQDFAIQYFAEDVQTGSVDNDYIIAGMLSDATSLNDCHDWAEFTGTE